MFCYNFGDGDNMNTKLIIEDLKRIPRFIIGLTILSFGIYLTKLAYIGLSPWSVLHDGIAMSLNLTFGTVTIFLGLIILVLSIVFLKTKIGIGTILNILIAGNLINLFEYLYYEIPSDLIMKIILFSIGLLCVTFGRSLYISSDLGPGPRDGLFVGLSRITHLEVKYIKPAIELTVLIIGILLGGNFSVGTIIIVITSGYLVQYFFKVLHFDPKKKTQSDIRNYIIVKNTQIKSR